MFLLVEGASLYSNSEGTHFPADPRSGRGGYFGYTGIPLFPSTQFGQKDNRYELHNMNPGL